MILEKEVIEDNAIISACLLSSGREIYIKAEAPIQIAYTDNRKDYTLVNIGEASEYVLDFESLFVFNNSIFLGTSLGRIFRSKDDGKTWQTVEDGIFSNAGCTFIRQIGNYLLAAFQNGIISRSLDNGDTWQQQENIEWSKVWVIGLVK